MTTPPDDEKLRDIADQHVSDDPVLAAQLYADADYLAQLRKPGNVQGGNEVGGDA